MKPVLAWVKSNVLIVGFSALILLMLPASWFVSTWWDAKILAAQQKSASDALTKLKGLKVDYGIPPYEPGGQPVTYKEVPNISLINWFKDQRENFSKQATAVVERAVQFNKGLGSDAASVGRSEHKPLVEGLFPSGNQAKIDEMEDTLLGKRGMTNPYRRLLTSVRAGDPADPAVLAQSIQDFRTNETQKVTAGKRDLTADEGEVIRKLLTDQRLAEYQSRANSVSVYASMDSLPRNPNGSYVPSGLHLDQQRMNLPDMYLFQWDYWILRDIFDAVKLANTTDGKLTNVDRSVVKRIDSISISIPSGMGRSEEVTSWRPTTPEGEAAAAPGAAGPGAMATLDPSLSITGRRAENGIYDTRTVTMSVVLSSARVGDFISAIERTNFMTVTDIDLHEVRLWDELARGYYYGPEHVVRADVEIETVWLRSWTTKFMPAKVRENLKVAPDEPAPEAPAEVPPPPG